MSAGTIDAESHGTSEDADPLDAPMRRPSRSVAPVARRPAFTAVVVIALA